MSAIAVIPARYDSERFPGKVLANLNGMPLVQHVYQRAVSAKYIDSAIVATDDVGVANALHGVPVVMTGKHPSGTDRVAEVARNLDCDIVVNVQGDEPLIEPHVIDVVVHSLFDAHMATARTPILDPTEVNNPNVVKVVCGHDGLAIYFSRSPIPYNRGRRDVKYWKHIGLYAYRRDFLLEFSGLDPTPLEQSERLEQLRALEYNFDIRVAEVEYDGIGVDVPEDLEKIRAILAR